VSLLVLTGCDGRKRHRSGFLTGPEGTVSAVESENSTSPTSLRGGSYKTPSVIRLPDFPSVCQRKAKALSHARQLGLNRRE